MVSPNRKQRIVMNEENFNLIVKFYTTKSTKDLVEMTNLSKSAINKCIKKMKIILIHQNSPLNIYSNVLEEDVMINLSSIKKYLNNF